jgi:hypothetical protein
MGHREELFGQVKEGEQSQIFPNSNLPQMASAFVACMVVYGSYQGQPMKAGVMGGNIPGLCNLEKVTSAFVCIYWDPV